MKQSAITIYQTALRQLLAHNIAKNSKLSSLIEGSSWRVMPYSLNHIINDQIELQKQLQKQIDEFNAFLPELETYAETQHIQINSVFDSYWNYVLPYFNHLQTKRELEKKCQIVGVLGVQGAGKTTLTSLLSLLCTKNNLNSIVFSIDDFYLSYEARQQLKKSDSRFQFRGPPGTHDIIQLKKVMESIKNKQLPIQVPIFDKSLHNGEGDISGVKEYINHPDIVIFEGWFTGLKRITPLTKLDPIITDEDLEFAEKCGELLEQYEEIWKMLDELIVISPEQFEYSREWRKLAERKMRQKTGNGMTDEQIDRFVDYFWKSLHPKIYLNKFLDNQDNYQLLLKLDQEHQIMEIISK